MEKIKKYAFALLMLIMLYPVLPIYAEEAEIVMENNHTVSYEDSSDDTDKPKEIGNVKYDGSIYDYIEPWQRERVSTFGTEEPLLNGFNVSSVKHGTLKKRTEETEDTEELPDVALMSLSSTDFEAISNPSFRNGVRNPHLSGRSASEYVSPYDGNLQLNVTDITLPGRNALDLAIGRFYANEHSDVEKTNTGGIYSVAPTTYFNRRYALGLGWSLAFPSVELRKKYDGTYQAYYHDGAGNAYRSNYKDSNKNEEGEDYYNGYLIYSTNLDNYYTDNVRFKEKDRSYSRDGIKSEYSFKRADNTMEYFAEDGRLLAIKDRFDNEIKFDYTNLPAENLIPFYSCEEFSLGSYWSSTNRILTFSGGSTNRTSEAKSQFVELDEFCNEYYVSVLYEASDANLSPFEGSVEVYCDLYSEDATLLESIMIGSATPDVYDTAMQIDGSFSIDDYDLDDIPVEARVRIKVVSGKYKIAFTDVRLSPKAPLITKITDTIGRTVEFEYEGDLYARYEDDPTFPIYITVKDPDGNEITEIEYYRYLYTHSITDDDGNYTAFHHYYLFGDWYGEDGLCWVNYDYFDGEGSSIYGNPKANKSYEFSGRPVVNYVSHRNSKTYFEYEEVRKWLDNRPASSTSDASYTNTGFIDSWRVIKKYDVDESLTDTENEAYNIYKYNYKTGSYTDSTGYNFMRTTTVDAEPEYLDPDGGSYIVKITTPSGSIETYEYTGHIFDEGFRLKWEIKLNLLDKKATLEDSASGADSVIQEYTYEDNFALISPTVTKTTETIDGTDRVYYNKVEYDSDSCLPIVSTLPLTEAEYSLDTIPEEKTIKTIYQKMSNRMFVPISNTYYQTSEGEALTESYLLDTLARVTQKIDAKGNVVNYEYDSAYPWLPSRVYFEDPEANGDNARIAETLYEYSDEYGIGPNKESIKYADGTYAHSTYEYEPQYGNVKKFTDSESNVTKYEYDEWGRIDYIYYPPYYSEEGLKYPYKSYYYTKHTDYGNTEVLRVRERLYLSDYSSYSSADEVYENCAYYDDYGNLLYTSTPMGEEKYIYDDALRLTGYQNQADYDTSNNTMSFAYDGFGRVTSYTDRLGNTQNATYKTLSTEYSFTPKGSSTQENNYVENFDIYGNKVSDTIYPDGLGGDSLTSTYEYDLLGNVLKITDANGKITSMTYDEVNNPTEIVLADGSNISYDYTKWNSVKTTTQYDGEQSYTISETFDDRGLATSHRQTGAAIKTKPWYYSYRPDGLISMSVAPDGTERSYEYDASGNTTGYSVGAIFNEMVYDHFGNLDKITRRVNGTETGATVYVYDSAKGWLNSKTTGLGTTSYTYNTTGMLASVISPSGLVRTYTRDANDRITSVSADDKDFTYEYYGDGLIKSITYPGGNIVTSYTYDNANCLTKLETKNGNNILKTYSYEYDGVGNIISVSGSENAEYTYDDLYRLATSTQNGHTTTYEYDSRNNLISETRTDGYTKTYEYSGDNRLVKTVENGVETAYEYDLRGNLVKRGEDEFAYDSNDNLVYAMVNGVETTYEIGEDGLRESKTVNGVTTTYSVDESGNVITEGNDEIILGNMPLAKKIGDNYYYYIYNAHGDVVMIVDESGNVQNTYEYDAWGAVINETETIANNHKYAGQYYDAETGLIYLRARYYDPSDRRFIQEDPARDERNWYVYCGDNPIMYIDPSGEGKVSGTLTAIAGGLGIGAIVSSGTIFGLPAGTVLGVAAGVATIAAGVADFLGAP